jgi:tetratricopeptide (TPR) repeat protein
LSPTNLYNQWFFIARIDWLRAELRKAQGRNEEAEALLRKHLDRDSDRDKLLCRTSLANLYAGQCDRNSANPLFRQALLEIQREDRYYPRPLQRWLRHSATRFYQQIGDETMMAVVAAEDPREEMLLRAAAGGYNFKSSAE